MQTTEPISRGGTPLPPPKLGKTPQFNEKLHFFHPPKIGKPPYVIKNFRFSIIVAPPRIYFIHSGPTRQISQFHPCL